MRRNHNNVTVSGTKRGKASHQCGKGSIMSSSQPEDVSCAGCDSQSIRKAAIVCSDCGGRWHTSCAKITVAQSRSLTIWHCSRCLGRDLPKSQVSSSHNDVQRDTQPESSCEGRFSSIPERLALLRQSLRVLRLIPKPARTVVADSLSKRMNDAIASTSPDAWWRLFSFAFSALRHPGPQTGRKCTLATLVKRQVLEDEMPDQDAHKQRDRVITSDSSTCADVARRVQAKCADGDIGAALRVLSSCDVKFVNLFLLIREPPAPSQRCSSAADGHAAQSKPKAPNLPALRAL